MKPTTHSLVALSFAVFILLRVRWQVHARRTRGPVSFAEGPGNLGARIVGALLFFTLLGLYLFRPETLNWADMGAPPWTGVLGAVLAFGSLPLLWWVHASLGSNFSSTLHLREQHTLVASGPYRWVRHPMYTVLLLFAFGQLWLTGNALVGGALIGGLVLVVTTRVGREEALMLRQFGPAYQAYIARTGSLLPRLW